MPSPLKTTLSCFYASYQRYLYINKYIHILYFLLFYTNGTTSRDSCCLFLLNNVSGFKVLLILWLYSIPLCHYNIIYLTRSPLIVIYVISIFLCACEFISYNPVCRGYTYTKRNPVNTGWYKGKINSPKIPTPRVNNFCTDPIECISG